MQSIGARPAVDGVGRWAQPNFDDQYGRGHSATRGEQECGTGTFTLALADLLAPSSVVHAIDSDASALRKIPSAHKSIRTSTMTKGAYEVLFVSERVGILDRNHRAQLSPLKTPNKPTAYDCQSIAWVLWLRRITH